MLPDTNQYNSNYDWVKGWENCNRGWHEHVITCSEVYDAVALNRKIVEWMYNTLDSCEKHARWGRMGTIVKVKFRYERDYLLFLLSWA